MHLSFAAYSLALCPALVLAQSAPSAPAPSFSLASWAPKAAPFPPNGQKVRVKEVKIVGQMEERGHWRKYFFHSLNDQASTEKQLTAAFAKMLSNKGFTVVDELEVPTYQVELHVDEPESGVGFFSGMGGAKPIQDGQPWLFKPKSFELVVRAYGEWRPNKSIAQDHAAAALGQGIMDKFQVRVSHKIVPKIQTGFLGVTGQQLMADPVFVDNASRALEGAVEAVLDFYGAKMDSEAVQDIVRKLRLR